MLQILAEKTSKGKKSHPQTLEAKAEINEEKEEALKCCFVSLAVAYFTAEEFEVFYFLCVLQNSRVEI